MATVPESRAAAGVADPDARYDGLTDAEYAALAAGGPEHYEVIDGVKVELPPMSPRAAGVSGELARLLGNFAADSGRGRAWPEILVRLPAPQARSRQPDVIFVSYAQWPKSRQLPDTRDWEVVPELCVEVVSPTDRAEDVRQKVEEYLAAGVRLVWVVYPRLGLVDVFEPGNTGRTRRRADTLDGGPVLPGFAVALPTLFPAADPEPDVGMKVS